LKVDVVDNKQNSKITEKKLTKFQEYFYANFLFWGFLVILAVISYFTCGAVWDDVTSGVMEFIFVIMGGGFTLMSVLDYLYEKHISPPTGEEEKS
jgi:hypothetical protein